MVNSSSTEEENDPTSEEEKDSTFQSSTPMNGNKNERK